MPADWRRRLMDRLLRPRRDRPRGHRAAEQRHELPPSHAGHGLPSQWVCRTISLPLGQRVGLWGRPELF